MGRPVDAGALGEPESESQRAVRIHSERFVRLLYQEFSSLRGDPLHAGRRQLEAIEHLDVELGNLVSAVEFTLNQDQELEYECFDAFLRFLTITSRNYDLLNFGRQLLGSTKLTNQLYGQCASSRALQSLNRYEEVITHATAGIKLAETMGRIELLNYSRRMLAGGLRALGRVEAAREELNLILALPANHGDLAENAMAHFLLGLIAFDAGDLPTAGRHFSVAALSQERLGEKFGEVLVLGCQAMLALRSEDFTAAEAHYLAVLRLARQIGDMRNEAGALSGLGNIASQRALYGQAKDFYSEALGIMRHIGSLESTAWLIGNLGLTAAEMGNPEEAEVLLQEELELHRETGHRLGQCATLRLLAHVALMRGHLYSAAKALKGSLQLAREVRATRETALALAPGAAMCLHSGALQICARLLAAAATIEQEMGLHYDNFVRRLLIDTKQKLFLSRDTVTTAGLESEWETGKSLSLDQAVLLMIDLADALSQDEELGTDTV